MRASVEGVANAGSGFSNGIAEGSVPSRGVASHAGGREAAAGVSDRPAYGLVSVEPGIGAGADGGSAESNGGCAEITEVVRVETPRELQSVERPPAGGQIVSSAGAVCADTPLGSIVVAIAAGGDVVEGIVRLIAGAGVLAQPVDLVIDLAEGCAT